MARPTWAVTGALAACGILAALSGVTAATTVVSFVINDDFPGDGEPGVRSDGNPVYADYRIDPIPPVNWCVDAAPYSQGLLFVRLNRKLDGDAGVQRCSDNPDGGGVDLGIPRNITLTIDDDAVCGLLADPLAGLPVTWTTGSSPLSCTVATNANPRIRLETLYKARAKATTIDFQTEMSGYPVSYVIRSDTAAVIALGQGQNEKVVAYAGTYHLVKFAAGTKPKTVGPAFYMPVQMTFTTSVAP